MHRCGRKPLLSLLLVTAIGSISICLLAVTLLNGEEGELRVLGGPWPRDQGGGGRPVGGGSIQREILNVNSERNKRGLPHNDRELPENGHEIATTGHTSVASAKVKNNSNISRGHEAEGGVAGGRVKVKKDNCTGPWPGYTDCQGKMEWMAGNWQKDSCYKEYGVDGSQCSYQTYLSTVEQWCPVPSHLVDTARLTKQTHTKPTYTLSGLTDQLSENIKFDWLQRRIITHWPHWTAALRTFEDHAPLNLTKKNILIHVGALSDKAKFKFAENADRGGPLGELVQWSDLIASLYLLGHAVDFSTEMEQLRAILKNKKTNGWCPPPPGSGKQYDVVFIDIVGLKQFKKLASSEFQHYQCLFRVLDSFGTEPQFNFKAWKPPGRKKGDYGQAWGNWNLNPRQFYTMYPHTPDNSFLGFVVGSSVQDTMPPPKKNMALVYGKELYMWEGKRDYLDILSRYLDIHATIGTTQLKKKKIDPSIVPGYVTDHGILNSTALQKLLAESKVFIGMGFPYEGPAPLEAIANGCFFLNPQLSPPLDRYNSQFLKGKPTLRALTSQNPYAENFIGSPYVFTFNMKDSQAVIKVMETIKNMESPPGYLPYEFTYEGVLERVMMYLQNQDFCSVTHQWPGKDSLVTKISSEGQSCKELCYEEGMVCEPALFPFLNSESVVKKHFECSSVTMENSVHGPSHDSHTHQCSLQTTPLLYTCVGSKSKVQRLCPCRTYRKGQVALCSTCTR